MITSKKTMDSKVLKEHKASEFARLLNHNTGINVSTILYSGTSSVELILPELDCDQMIILGKFLKFSFPIKTLGSLKASIKSRRNLTILNIPTISLNGWYERKENEIIRVLIQKVKSNV